MTKKWFEMKERGAGVKRLLLTWYIYKYLGEFPVRLIAFFMALVVFLTARDRRLVSEKFYKQIGKPPLFSTFKQFLNYANALVDKMIAFSGNLDPQNIVFESSNDFAGTFFISTHVGNVEILRSMLSENKDTRINVFLQSSACEIFNNFLKHVEMKVNLEVFAVEKISPNTSITIAERLENGEIVFMAGDRVSAQNANKFYEKPFLGDKITLPIGILKFALVMNAPICFITCVKDGKRYRVFTKEFHAKSELRSEKLDQLQSEYVEFLEYYAKKYPYQYYNW